MEITDEKLDKYFAITKEALQVAENSANPEKEKQAKEVLDMVERYLSDAKHFREKNDKVTSFAALNYAHGWLDCAARLKVIVVSDNRLFTEDGED